MCLKVIIRDSQGVDTRPSVFCIESLIKGYLESDLCWFGDDQCQTGVLKKSHFKLQRVLASTVIRSKHNIFFPETRRFPISVRFLMEILFDKIKFK